MRRTNHWFADHHALWQVPATRRGRPLGDGVVRVDDNPKQEATPTQSTIKRLVRASQISPDELWNEGEAAVYGPHDSIQVITPSLEHGWMFNLEANEIGRSMWLQSPRWSLAQLAGGFSASAFAEQSTSRRPRRPWLPLRPSLNAPRPQCQLPRERL